MAADAGTGQSQNH